jgi:hypothetical protein
MQMNQKGFGLLETVISVGILTVIGYVVISQTELLGREKMSAEAYGRLTDLTKSVKLALGDKATCSTFAGGITLGQMGSISGSQGPSATEGDGVFGVAVGGEIQGKHLVNPYKKILDSTGNSVPEPILTWDAAHNKYMDLSDGTEIKKVQLIRDRTRKILRITFQKSERVTKPSLGGMTATKDIFITGTLNGQTLLDCESEFKITKKEYCSNSSGAQWTSSQNCNYPADLRKVPPAPLGRPLYMIGGKLVSDNLRVTSTASCRCPSGNCTCTCRPTCPVGTIQEIPPRFLVNNQHTIWPIVQLTGPQVCQYVTNCYTRIPIPAGTLPVGRLMK